MLHQLRQRASEALLTQHKIVLSTSGPAEIQAETLHCEAVGLALYVLVVRTSDLLFNLESNPQVVATAETWQLRGVVRLLQPCEYPDQLSIAKAPEAAWCQVVEIKPARLHLYPPYGETIDLW